MSPTGIGLIVISKTTTSACGLPTGNKVISEIIINKYNNYKKQHEKDQQTFKSSHRLHKKSLRDNIIDKNGYECLCNIFTENVDENKNESLF